MKNILYTRLIRPKSKNTIKRNKNIQGKLDKISENKLTIVQGSAAVGKSTLISNHIGQMNSYMWLSLDENSDDLSYFWTYILHGLKNNIENINFYIDMINPLVNRNDIFELLLALINELIDAEDLFIVIDDFHYIEDTFLLETIEYFISNSGENIHFILISRHDINLYLGNILMKGGVVYISADDFYLTLEETEEFIRSSTNKVLEREEINEIYLNTEGWIGAIKLLLTIFDSDKCVKNIPKGNKLFLDYMNNEIINSLSREEIDFLVKTSPLSYVNPSIYKEIGTEDGLEIINKLIEKNMLIIAIDEEQKIYRYHNVLRQYLMERFSRFDEEDRNKTIDKLTSSLIKEENYDEAISIFIHWNRYEDGIKVVEKYAQNIINTKLLNEFPIDYYSQSIDLAFITIFYNYINLDYEKCSLICSSLDDYAENNILKSIKVFKLVLGNSFVNDSYFDLLTEIDDNLNALTKTIYYIIASWALGFWGQCKKAMEMQERIKKTNKELNNSYVDLVYEYNKVSILEEMGKLNESEAGYKQLEEKINSKNYKSCFSIFRTVGLPGVYIKKLMDKEAEALLKEAEVMIKDFKGRSVSDSMNYGVIYNLAEVKYIQGKIDECESLINNLNMGNEENYVYIQIVGLKIRLLSTEGRIKKEEINEFINAFEKIYKNSKCIGEVQITYGLSLFEIGKYEESLDVFNNIVFMCRKNKIGYFLVYSLLWKLIVMNKIKQDSKRECLNILKEAIFYSRDEDILFPYYKNRKYLKEIIQKFRKEILEDKDNERFIRRLDDIFGVKDENEVLSSRELEVLQALIDGLSNKEIGEKLFISVSTVKTHIINIYSKLGVKNRVEAVNEGRKIIDFAK